MAEVQKARRLSFEQGFHQPASQLNFKVTTCDLEREPQTVLIGALARPVPNAVCPSARIH